MRSVALGLMCMASPATAQMPARPALPDSVTIRIVGIELRSAVQIIQQYIDRPIIFSGTGAGPQVPLETPRPAALADVPRLLRVLLDSQGYELVTDTASGTYRARLKEQPPVRAANPSPASPTPYSQAPGQSVPATRPAG